MGDAEIIPIGTRGRPGRGSATGGAKPSSASRGLAGPAKKAPAKKAAPKKAPAPKPAEEVAPEPVEAPVRDVVREATTANDRGPLAGIPVGDWLAAFQHAGKELFGEQWEPQLARFLAFLRRRVSGDYVVDEYGFDQEITERFFMTALRPIAQKWFRIEVRGCLLYTSDAADE